MLFKLWVATLVGQEECENDEFMPFQKYKEESSQIQVISSLLGIICIDIFSHMIHQKCVAKAVFLAFRGDFGRVARKNTERLVSSDSRTNYS